MVVKRIQVKQSLDASAVKLIAFLEVNRAARIFKFPFSYSYPQNCCEGVSLIFKYLAFEVYGFQVEVWRGRKRSGEMHFWNVTAGGLIYDLTCHQFSGAKPVIGKFVSGTAHRFRHDVEVNHAEWHVERQHVIDAYRIGIIPF